MPHARLSFRQTRLAAASGRRGPATGRQLQDALWEKKIRVRSQGEAGVRLSAHLYVSPADIDRVLEVVSSMRG